VSTGVDKNKKWGIVLLNMGGPKTLDDIEPFLFNLLSDPRIISIPMGWIRRLVAKRIAHKRTPSVLPRYKAIGGGSPILEQTEKQAEALKAKLSDVNCEVEVAMRYTEPRADDALAKLKDKAVSNILALPLYPQYSKTTSGSSLEELQLEANSIGLPMHQIESYPVMAGFIDAIKEDMLFKVSQMTKPTVVFVAHGLPLKVAKKDLYPAHVQQTAEKLAGYLPENVEWELAFQSRLGPLEWMKPYVTDRVVELGAKGVKEIVLVPVSFVSEHIETLHELDIELKELAFEAGIKDYRRVKTVQADDRFVSGLAELVRDKIAKVESKDLL